MSKVQHITVGPDESEQRLDRWFRRHFPQVGQGRVEKLCRKGDIRVNGGRVKASTRVVPGQDIRIPPMPDSPAPVHETRTMSADDVRLIQETVLFRDDHLIVINKPSGLASQGGSGQTRHVDGLAEALKFGLVEKPRLVHRLDKDTSGILVLARTQRMATALTAAFRHRETRKIYWAAVAGVPLPRMGTIKFGLIKASGGKSGNEKMRCVHPDELGTTTGAKRATTDYAVLSKLGNRAAWVALAPITGRTHQLRAHMAEIGHPVIGDGKYGGSGQENLGDGWGAQLGGDHSKRLHLHARSLRFEHPANRSVMSFTAPLPEHMKKTWAEVEWHADDVPEDPFEGEG
ncbi:MAG: RluA family pseudouridine synthase [Paracoccaceae bacterium]